MGWASGTTIAEGFIRDMKKQIKDKAIRKIIYISFLEHMTNADWDTVDEAGGHDPIFDDVVKEYYA